jgi:hypothetical protein
MLGGNNIVSGTRDATRAAVDEALVKIDQDLKARTLPPEMAQAWQSAAVNWREVAGAIDAHKLSDVQKPARLSPGGLRVRHLPYAQIV